MKALYIIPVIIVIWLSYQAGHNVGTCDMTDEYWRGHENGAELAMIKNELFSYQHPIRAGDIYDVILNQEMEVSYLRCDGLERSHYALEGQPIVDEVTYNWFVRYDGDIVVRIFNQTHNDILLRVFDEDIGQDAMIMRFQQEDNSDE